MADFSGIIDVYDGNAPDLDDAWAQGVRVIFWETGQGFCRTDSMYEQCKTQALNKGFLWGAYHLLSSEDAKSQIDHFLTIEDGSDPRVALALDWEPCCVPKATLSYNDMRTAIQYFNNKMKPTYSNRFPILYGGDTIRSCAQLTQGDPVFGSCPLWYQRYLSTPVGLPTKTWLNYTFWQYDDEHRQNGGPPTNVLPGADWNRYPGTFAQLQAAWPFSGPPAALVADAD